MFLCVIIKWVDCFFDETRDNLIIFAANRKGKEMIVNSDAMFEPSQCFFVPNIVANNLIQECRPVYIAVYLYALCQYNSGNCNISNLHIAEALKINPIDVVNAFLFFNSKGLLKVHNFKSVDDAEFDIEFIGTGDYNKKTVSAFRPSYKTEEIARNLNDNPRLSGMYKMVSQILGKTLSTSDIELLYSFHDFYALPIEVIIVLIEYFVSKGKRSLKYLEKEVAKWANAGVDSVRKAKNFIKKREDFLSYAYRVRSVCGISERKLTERELTFINRWQNEYKSTEEDVKKAFEITVDKTGKIAFAYMDAILKSMASGIQDTKKTQQRTLQTKTNPRYNFEELQRRAFENINKKSGGGAD